MEDVLRQVDEAMEGDGVRKENLENASSAMGEKLQGRENDDEEEL